jgi:ketosteroid isomerase-like protein
MRKTILITLFLISSTALVWSQSKAESQITEAINIWRKAMIDADKISLANSLADELSYGHSSGKIETKADLIESISSGKSDFITMDLSEQTIRFAGKTAIVRHKLVGEINDGGIPGTIKLFVLQIWQKQSGKWKLLARQAVKQI